MKILVMNAGSSSVKFKLFKVDTGNMLAAGLIERIKTPKAHLYYSNYRGNRFDKVIKAESYEAAITAACDALLNSETGVLRSLGEIKSIGHRVVHGGSTISKSCAIDSATKFAIRSCYTLAPIHNPPNLECIEACESIFPDIQMVAVFDTAFHQSMPAKAYTYAIPADIAKENGIRRYGFHGTSHHYVANACAKALDRNLNELKLITAHLGNGCSITAIDKGQVVDTSMGLTPLEGLVMGTRCGDIDPSIICLLQEKGYTPENIDTMLNKSSGLLGLAQIGSNDMRDVRKAIGEGNEQAQLAFDVFIHRLIKYIGAYTAVLNGVDALVFTAGVGENVPPVRSATCASLSYLGVEIDEEKNLRNDQVISVTGSKPVVMVIPTNEELMIARETARILNMN
jgi:acetate kinase